ncbi:hypothetical protein ILUMI_09194 [Ignelater luminosus]|uniref:Centrosomin N-terminal motif 1 domain-containing protein n=1 Tax=Ignelater luminosus TaxID=2038154 RepID=A0A8K0D4Q7_IGNLU|nr:hypothetical protein ILUMI_09194 [Ignelater luminosus]
MKKSHETGGSLRSLDSCSSSDLDSDVLAKVSDMGLRSPGAVTSGRSVKEIDEQLTNLRKENFNLKLRIYFLEERMGANFNTDKEDAIKKNIELMVELENVRKDLEDKQELLCQAAKAMEIEEEEKKKEIIIRDQEILELKEALDEVRNQLQSVVQKNEESKELGLCAEAFDLNLKENSTADIVKKLQNTIKDLQVELSKERERADHFENIMELAESAHVRCKSLETEVEDRESKLTNLTCELEESGTKIMSFNQRIEALEEELSEKTTQLQNTVIELRQKDRELKEHQTEMQELNKLCLATQQQNEKSERKVEKYKAMLLQSETKNHEMMTYIDTLKNKIQNLEIRLEAALDEVKKANSKTETVISTDQKAKSNNTDVALFSVRNPMSICETPKSSSKSSPKIINRSPKSVHSKSLSKSTMSIKSQPNIDSHSQEVPESKSVTPTEISSEIHLSNEELLELKKNHYKACKMLKAMIQRKGEYVEQIEKLQALVVEKGSEIESLQTKIVELTESNNALAAGQKKKSIQELVSELNLTASSNPAANKEFWVYVMSSIQALVPYLQEIK